MKTFIIFCEFALAIILFFFWALLLVTPPVGTAVALTIAVIVSITGSLIIIIIGAFNDYLFDKIDKREKTYSKKQLVTTPDEIPIKKEGSNPSGSEVFIEDIRPYQNTNITYLVTRLFKAILGFFLFFILMSMISSALFYFIS